MTNPLLESESRHDRHQFSTSAFHASNPLVNRRPTASNRPSAPPFLSSIVTGISITSSDSQQLCSIRFTATTSELPIGLPSAATTNLTSTISVDSPAATRAGRDGYETVEKVFDARSDGWNVFRWNGGRWRNPEWRCWG